MASIRSKNTKPELALREALRASGATGYRIHRKDLPGRPDIAFIRWKVAVFVDGVFWHGHPDHWHPEKTVSEYWRHKIQRNMDRDAAANAALHDDGWTVIRIWDQEIENDVVGSVQRILDALLSSGWSARR